jgi:F-type H+-transporting ATPase subunit b
LKIDLFTLIAQIINFLVLVALLRHFLYKRVVRVMDEREKRIAHRLEEAEDKNKQAEQEAQSYHRKQKEWEEKKEGLLSQAKDKAEEKRKEWMEELRKEVEESEKKWRQSLRRQKQAFLKDLRQRTSEQVYLIARQVLKDLADEDIERLILETFKQRLEKMGKEQKKETQQAILQSGKAVVRSAFSLSKNEQEKIKRVIQEMGTNGGDIHFEVKKDLICGVELDTGSTKISWNINSYLNTLEQQLSEFMERKLSPADENKPNAKKK